MNYQILHDQLHALEVTLADLMNRSANPREQTALERAHDLLVHQVAEWVRTAEQRVTFE